MKNDSYSLKNLMVFIFIVMVVIVLFYGLTSLITKNEKNIEKNKQKEETVIQYDEILVGDIFSKTESEYFVLAAFENDTELSNYNSLVSEYSSKEKSLKVYTINLSSGFNKKYVSEFSNFDSIYPQFNRSTLIKISNKKILEIYEGPTKIKNALNNLVS